MKIAFLVEGFFATGFLLVFFFFSFRSVHRIWPIAAERVPQVMRKSVIEPGSPISENIEHVKIVLRRTTLHALQVQARRKASE